MPVLNGETVDHINSRLRPKPERPDPQRLKANEGLSFVGSIALGAGFVLTPEEREKLIEKDPRNAERIFPYIGGREVNTSPTQDYHRYVINFGKMTLEEAELWPDLIKIIRELVKPERDKNKRGIRRRYWWRFGEAASGLYKVIAPLNRCLVTACVAKHVIFSSQPANRVFSQKLFAFPLVRYAYLGLLQSRIHRPWVWLLSSTMKTDLSYSASKCFETFPFPPGVSLQEGAPLDQAGEALNEARVAFMISTNQGLTKTYNALKDPNNTDPPILELRLLHEVVDRTVLAAYGWGDIEVPPYEERSQAFEDEVIDRLFVLNAERAEEERSSCPS